jgi:hypothetical protein
MESNHVAVHWSAIEYWLSAHAPDISASLQPGRGDEALGPYGQKTRTPAVWMKKVYLRVA